MVMRPADLADQLTARFAREYPDLLNTRLMVALSGGADSVALLYLLGDPRLGLELEAAHVHHGARGAEADADAAFCASLCERLGLRLHLLRLTAGPAPAGREATWRRARYARLLELARERSAVAVATGHHRDDVAEGVLVQLLRGTGPRGLAGIAARTATGVIRPLLGLGHDELTAWLRARGIAWREDTSNQSPEHLRNLVRHQVLPDLERIASGLRGHLVNLARALADDEHELSAQLEAQATWIDPWHPQGGVSVKRLQDLSAALRARWLHAQVERIGAGTSTNKVTRAHIELLRRMLDTGEPRAIALAGRWSLYQARGYLWLEPPQGRLEPTRATVLDTGVLDTGVLDTGVLDTGEPGLHALGVPTWCLVARSSAESGDQERWLTPEGRLWAWSPPPGARVTVQGRSEKERGQVLADGADVTLLTRQRLPRHLRSAWPRFWVGDKIEWIPGIWQDQPAGNRGSLVLEVVRQ